MRRNATFSSYGESLYSATLLLVYLHRLTVPLMLHLKFKVTKRIKKCHKAFQHFSRPEKLQRRKQTDRTFNLNKDFSLLTRKLQGRTSPQRHSTGTQCTSHWLLLLGNTSATCLLQSTTKIYHRKLFFITNTHKTK